MMSWRFSGAAALGVWLLAACAPSSPTDADLAALNAQADALARDLSAAAVDDSAGVVVRLMFDEAVDLDLYVTDPLLDTVYFARHESRTGGVISEDVRCDTAGSRVEEVRFDSLWPGRYRVGVDFPRRCDGARSIHPAPYAVEVSAAGQTHRMHGLVNLEFFEVEVLAFEVEEGES